VSLQILVSHHFTAPHNLDWWRFHTFPLTRISRTPTERR
jgi:hypothetical protein